MGAITAALAASFKASSGTIRAAADVREILVRHGRTVGVALADGEEIHAAIVISNLDVRRTFLKTMQAEHLPDEFLQQVRNFKIRGSSGKLNIAPVSYTHLAQTAHCPSRIWELPDDHSCPEHGRLARARRHP